jgi:hypothetical protein
MKISAAEISYRDSHEHNLRLVKARQDDKIIRDHREFTKRLEEDRIERARRMDLDQGRHVDRYA